MENYGIIILIMALMISASAIAVKIRVPAPLLLIIVGLVIGFMPGLPPISLDPQMIMLIFLPPLLYDAAFNISFNDFKTHMHTISTLAVGLVLVTIVGLALIARYTLPGMTWPLSFVLGAILSATDAVAAIGITKGLGLSKRTITILEGESLMNDASALVGYRFAIAAVTGVAFIWWKASLSFVVVLSGGVVLGLVISKLLAITLRLFRENELVILCLILLMPFVTYFMAESLKVSGVIAVVVLGLGISRLSKERFPEKMKQQSGHFWEVIIFLLNGLIFVLIGLQFPIVLRNTEPGKIWLYLGCAFLLALGALVIRLGRVYFQQYQLHRAYNKKYMMSSEILLDSRSSLIISWSGMRGIVSLAIAIGLPVTLDNGQSFPMRNTIIFLTIAVVLFSLFGQGLTLPWLVRKTAINHQYINESEIINKKHEKTSR